MNETSAPPSDNNRAEAKEHPGLVDSLNQVNQAGQQTLDSATQAFTALGNLLSADLALARGALRQTLMWSTAVVVFATSAWLLLVLALVVFMYWLGLPWILALLFSGLISLLAAFAALNRVRFYLRHTDLAATRRQLTQLHWPKPAEKPSNTTLKPDTSSANMANSGQGL